ncbi:ZIP family metal transporter [Proteinivorax hydrogeniformans]|uniref:ZIP family metal transporter n=1 Tax=Proteinivorax hydrogeniformans TaxID=1826727 RepID=A0AAU8HWC8_9FIRM
MFNDIIISTLAGLSTAIGAVLIIVMGKPPDKMVSTMLGFAAGIMIAISTLELIPEAVELGGTFIAALGFVLGTFLMLVLDGLIPHAHMGSGEKESKESEMKKMGYFIFFGIALHNLPEGLAIGAGFEAQGTLGFTIALALAIHNIPEGMATAVPLIKGGVSKGKVFILTLFAGLMTPVGTALGFLIFNISQDFVAVSLSLAAGAMIYIVGDELIPQSHKQHSHTANLGLLAGFLLGLIIV